MNKYRTSSERGIATWKEEKEMLDRISQNGREKTAQTWFAGQDETGKDTKSRAKAGYEG